MRLERHGDRRVPRHSAEHAEVQDGQARRPPAREAPSRRLIAALSAIKNLAASAKPLPRSPQFPDSSQLIAAALDAPRSTRGQLVARTLRRSLAHRRRDRGRTIAIFSNKSAYDSRHRTPAGTPVAVSCRSDGRRVAQPRTGPATSQRVRLAVSVVGEQRCSHRCSTFVCRSPARDDVFLMNTLTDAQLVVSPDVAALLDRVDGRDDAATLDRRRARRARRCCGENGFLVPDREHRAARARRRTSRAIKSDTVRAARHGADDAAVQLRVRLLLPGRSRRLQQVRREDVARDGARASATGSSASSIACSPEQLHADVLRRRAAAQPAGRCTTWPSGCGSATQARGVTHGDQHHHQRPAADAGGRRSAAAASG